MTLADELVALLAPSKTYINSDGDITFYLHNIDAAQMVKGLLAQWKWDREGYGPWVADGDHWDHKHPDGIVFHHPAKGCPELS